MNNAVYAPKHELLTLGSSVLKTNIIICCSTKIHSRAIFLASRYVTSLTRFQAELVCPRLNQFIGSSCQNYYANKDPKNAAVKLNDALTGQCRDIIRFARSARVRLTTVLYPKKALFNCALGSGTSVLGATN